ncbi:MAG: redoxin domain-containing protein [Actinobacteria bacterium]|nr:redoxin domain-containing protein [Actinomycetota bacterium]
MVHVRDIIEEFARRKTVVLGVSAEPRETLEKYLRAHELPFTIINDVDREIIRKYDIFYDARDINPDSKRGLIARPTNMILDPDGIVRYLYIGEDEQDFPPDQEMFDAIEHL